MLNIILTIIGFVLVTIPIVILVKNAREEPSTPEDYIAKTNKIKTGIVFAFLGILVFAFNFYLMNR